MASKAEVSSKETSLGTNGEFPLSVTVNGHLHETAVPSDLALVDFIRNQLHLTGTKSACETGHCGACVVLLDGLSVKSCTVLAAQADGSHITTIEGVAHGGALTALQKAMSEKHAVQCGYCTPGLVLSLTDLLSRNARPNEAEIRSWIDGNICRCGVYQNVVRAVESLTAEPR